MLQTGLQITCLWQYFSADNKFSEIHEILLYSEKLSVQLLDCFWPKNREKYSMLKQWKIFLQWISIFWIPPIFKTTIKEEEEKDCIILEMIQRYTEENF